MLEHETAPVRAEKSLPALSTLERMEVVFADHGFMPYTSDELNEVVSIDAFASHPGGVAKHLNEILQHQNRAATDDPAQGVKSKTEEYAWFATQAHQDALELLGLHHRVAGMLNPRLSLDTYLREDEDVQAGSTSVSDQPGVHQLLRHMALEHYRLTGEELRPGFNILKKQARNRGANGERVVIDVFASAESGSFFQTYTDAHLKEVKISDLRGGDTSVVADAIGAAMNRFEYWVDVLEVSKAHLLARPIANRVLGALIVQHGETP